MAISQQEPPEASASQHLMHVLNAKDAKSAATDSSPVDNVFLAVRPRDVFTTSIASV